MFNVNFMLAQTIQNDYLRVAQRDRLVRQWLKEARKKVEAKRSKREKK